MLSVPDATPVTTPALFTVAIPVYKEVHVPPLTVSLKETVDVAHTVLAPLIAPASGKGFMVIKCVAVAVPQLLVTE